MSAAEATFRKQHVAPSSGVPQQTVETGASITISESSRSVEKAIVAVHGIGDQHTYATIQAVVNQFSGFHPTAVPLGTFHDNKGIVALKPALPSGYAFAEVYWATIPREAAKDAYIIEEAKAWARTIIGRLKLRWQQSGDRHSCSERDFHLMALVLSEMVESIAILDRLCLLADRAGLFKFDLRKTMEDYFGDVQVVVDFSSLRERILETFDRTLSAVHEAFPNAKIYLVAHSEGTVVSLLGLLHAYRKDQPPPWSKHVAGFMTLGSPIDKHLVLWPDLFGEGAPRSAPAQPIEWHNYYDRGDPVGFALDDTRAWLAAHGWQQAFDFKAEYDHGFSRYAFPGKAHVDYWNDGEVFRHFIDTVVERRIESASPDSTPDATETRITHPAVLPPAPKDKIGVKLVSYTVPYLLVLGIMGIGAYFFFRAARAFLYPLEAEDIAALRVAKNVFAIAFLLMGITAAARIPRLTHDLPWRLAGAACGMIAAGVYVWSQVDVKNIELFGIVIPTEILVLLLTTALVLTAYIAGSRYPHLGIKPLVIGGVVACAIYLTLRVEDWSRVGPLWPVGIAMVALLYLWWLGALLFDLIFMWHLYIRNTRLQERMDKLLHVQLARQGA
jgi:hypothetical protein